MNKKGQTSVEYLLLLGLVASMIFSLVGVSDYIKQRVTIVKAGLRNKLAGSVALSRADFGSPGVRFAADDDMEGISGKGTGGKGIGGRDGSGKDGKGKDGKGKGKKGKGAELSDTEREEEGGKGEGRYDEGGELVDGEGQRIRRFSDDEYYYETDRYGNRVLKRRKKTGKGVLKRGEEDEDKKAIMIKENLDESVYYRDPDQEETNFTLWKILLIVGIVVFFFIVIMKARQGKDD